ncbi:MarR family transcriptional regulator [Sporosarcina sp. BI001-red]|uniref:MarR family winged helix-turn-helix transcriptional regulator n=1 Tax=Sporosarcina sp. BI001-red TaxID=2282866 RepID=UPI000E282988|nr:MarR family transcriptional regulator [Sporosarcina sp. BI001-red]REB07851.1 MarR family transcriptional regulator [Sporosarcina sp. BI001-red]
MKETLLEAIELFEEVMIYGTEHFIKSVQSPIWKEYSPEQIQTLKLLSAYDSLSNGKLAELQGVHKSAITARLKKLEEKGLIRTERAQHDQRAKVVRLTEEGQEILVASNTAINETITSLFSDEISEEELVQFVRTFRKLKDILQMREFNE